MAGKRSKSPSRSARSTNPDGSVKSIALTDLFQPPTPAASSSSVSTENNTATASMASPSENVSGDVAADQTDTAGSSSHRLESSQASSTEEGATFPERVGNDNGSGNGNEDSDESRKKSVTTSAPSRVPNPPFGTPDGERIPITVAFGPSNSWFIRWNDGTSAYDRLPQTLHGKLSSRLPTLPGVRNLSLSDTGDWFVSFDDGSFATSGFTRGKLFDALNSGDTDITLLVFAPGGGFLLVREDATMVWDRLPTSLAQLLSQRTPKDAPIESVSISQLGSWFVRFEDYKCVWEGLPPRLVALVSGILRRNPPHLVLALSPTVMGQYFLAVGSAYEHNMTAITSLDQAIAFSKCEPNELTATVSYTLPKKSPKINSKDFEFLFRSTPKDIPLHGYDGNDDFLDPSMVNNNNDDSYIPDEEIDTPGLLLRAPPPPAVNDGPALWGGTVRSRNASFDAQALSTSNNHLDSAEIFPSDLSVNRGANGANGSPTIQIGQNIINSVSSLWGTYKHHFTGELPQNSRGSVSPAGEFSAPQHYTGQMTDHTEEQINSIMLRLRNMQSVIQNMLSNRNLVIDDAQVEHLARLMDHVGKLVQDPLPIHETEYFILYVEGYVEALTPRAMPHPWMEGYIEGRFGISSQDVADAVEKWLRSEQPDNTNTENINHNNNNFNNDLNEDINPRTPVNEARKSETYSPPPLDMEEIDDGTAPEEYEQAPEPEPEYEPEPEPETEPIQEPEQVQEPEPEHVQEQEEEFEDPQAEPAEKEEARNEDSGINEDI